ncbi:DNA-binding protein [Scytonema hofmannii PCC 7110]|uniref:DNA-binding protein n=1 Tax=Scytonema hofmannii PCC 7110 TaxID=128403 RepID=A0A139X766_9CYAN|nr:excisionase family DNA-binding protein [Scytonema hofmannii]KYC40537.1 DNA-binding protein [Scytonema hofmannii PCC 7110]
MTIILGTTASLESAVAQEQEAQTLKQLEQILRTEGNIAKIVGANGEQIDIPESLRQVLHYIVQSFVKGETISIIPENCEMTTQQAADFLNVSRPYLIKLLEQEDIPYIKVGTHRRVLFRDLMKYKEQRDIKRRQALQELTEFLQDEGFYDEEKSFSTR